ncbi:MAG TPA: PAS domain S-box protein [Kofleriaceae bacterium]|nr:PAS domain S-box protein [Kofleriaceae bacterium]
MKNPLSPPSPSDVALDLVSVPLVTVGLGGGGHVELLDANRAALDLVRAESADQLRGQIDRVLLPDAVRELCRLLSILSSGGGAAAGELEVGTLADERIPVAATCRADLDGSPPVAVVTLVDLRHSRRLERELGEHAVRQRALLDGIPDVVLEIDADGVYCGFAGPRSACSTSPALFLGKRTDEIALREIAPPALEAIARVCRTGRAETVEYSLPFEGAMRALEVRVAPISGGGAVVVVRDATERRRTEERLQESEARFRIMADYAPVLLWMAATNGLCTFFNRRWLEFRGRTQEEEYGTAWAGGVHPEDFQRCMHVYMEAFVSRQPFRMEYRLRRADGEYRWILDTGMPRHATDGSFAGFIGSCIDITELRELRNDLDLRVRERTDELAATVQELEAFCYSVSHDLRAPLRAIDGFSQALLEEYGDVIDQQGQDYLRRARSGASRMGELIDALLKLSRIGRAALRQVDIDLSGLARQVASDLERAYPDRRVQFTIQDGLVARGDPLLRTVLENLLDNAVKFTTRSTDPVVEFGATRVGGQLAYFVRDNGVGFDMAYSKRLFGAFQRLHSAADFPGTGVGLASVQRVIHRHGGRVWVEATEGTGATFYWTLPEMAIA